MWSISKGTLSVTGFFLFHPQIEHELYFCVPY
jgi:hypothetical protein